MIWRDPIAHQLGCAEDGLENVIDQILEEWGEHGSLSAENVLGYLAIIREAKTHVEHCQHRLEMRARGISEEPAEATLEVSTQ